jgi:hypothetical protein
MALPFFRFDFESVGRFCSTTEESFAAFHVVIEIEKNGSKSRRLHVYQTRHGEVVVRCVLKNKDYIM